MKEKINHKGWIKALLSFFLLFIPQTLGVLVLIFLVMILPKFLVLILI